MENKIDRLLIREYIDSSVVDVRFAGLLNSWIDFRLIEKPSKAYNIKRTGVQVYHKSHDTKMYLKYILNSVWWSGGCYEGRFVLSCTVDEGLPVHSINTIQA